MEVPVFSSLRVNSDGVTTLMPPIEFHCRVEGRPLKALITHQEDNGCEFIYHISFSDGHTASFVAPMEGGRWHDESFASPYAKAIRDDLNGFCGFLPAKPPLCIRLRGDREAFNVWIVPHASKALHYSIFFKGDYAFDLRRTTSWEAMTVRENSNIDREIAAIACKNIEQKILKPELF